MTPYERVVQLLLNEGWDPYNLPEENRLVILPMKGRHNYLTEDLIRAGAIWDERKAQWVVQLQ